MSGYGLLPFRFARFDDARTIVVNEAGEHHFLANDDVTRFVMHELPADSDPFLDLKAKHFLYDSSSLAPFELLATKIRSKKAFLDGFTNLHIFVVSLRCEHSCHYCQVSRVSADRTRYDMSEETARRALDLAFRSPAPRLKIEIQGGEPLLHFDRVRQIVEEARRRADDQGREIEVVVTTNLSCSTTACWISFAITAFFCRRRSTAPRRSTMRIGRGLGMTVMRRQWTASGARGRRLVMIASPHS
jgi:hypothetical protein